MLHGILFGLANEPRIGSMVHKTCTGINIGGKNMNYDFPLSAKCQQKCDNMGVPRASIVEGLGLSLCRSSSSASD